MSKTSASAVRCLTSTHVIHLLNTDLLYVQRTIANCFAGFREPASVCRSLSILGISAASYFVDATSTGLRQFHADRTSVT